MHGREKGERGGGRGRGGGGGGDEGGGMHGREKGERGGGGGENKRKRSLRTPHINIFSMLEATRSTDLNSLDSQEKRAAQVGLDPQLPSIQLFMRQFYL